MMWDFSGGANAPQGPPQHHHQARRRSPAPVFPTPSTNAPLPYQQVGALSPYGPEFQSSPYGGDFRSQALDAYVQHARSPVATGHAHYHHSHHVHTHHPRHSAHHHSNHSNPSRARPQVAAIQQVQPAAVQPHHHHSFFYSKCTGKKKALCIGINYRGQKNELHGCVNDAKNMQNFLIHHYRYKPDDVVLLVDDSPEPRHRPTRANILEAMHWLVRNAHPHDSLFFHYSGHGGQTRDRDGDEVDGYDEVIYPVDYRQSGFIVDDLMHTIMVKSLPAGCRLTALFDSCHSGSVLDLPYLYHTDGRVKSSQVTPSHITEKSTFADVVSWSGCKDAGTSADTWERGTGAVGAMSYAFMSSLSHNPNQSYQELLKSVRDILRTHYKQKPQLSSSHRIDTNLKFIM